MFELLWDYSLYFVGQEEKEYIFSVRIGFQNEMLLPGLLEMDAWYLRYHYASHLAWGSVDISTKLWEMELCVILVYVRQPFLVMYEFQREASLKMFILFYCCGPEWGW